MGLATGDSQLVFTDAVALNGGTLNLTLSGNTVLIAGQTDFSNLDELDITGGAFEIEAGASITLTADQADGVNITGEGEVFITELGADAVDLSGIQNTGGGTITLADEAAITLDAATVLTGALELQIGDTDLTLFADRMMVNAPDPENAGSTVEVGLNITGATGTVDVTGYENDNGTAPDLDLSNVQTAIAGTLILSGDAVASEETDFGDFAIDIGEFELTATADQLDGVTVNNAPGGGVFVTNLELTPEADLSDVLTADGNESLVNAQLTTTTDETITLTAEKLGIAKVFIAGPGTVNVEGTFLDYDRDEDGEIVTTGEMARFEVNVGATLALTAEQADGREVEGDGTLNIGDLGQGPADIDLSNIALATGAFAAVATDLTLESDADLGQVGEGEGVLFAVEEGITFALNSRQADEQRIEGEGSTLIDTVGEQVREVQITEADSNAGDKSITINYTLNGEAGSVTVNNSVTNFTGQAAITNALLAAFASVDAITAANAGDGLLRLTADAEVDFTIDSIAAVDTDDVLEAEVADSYLVSNNDLGFVATAEKEITFDQDVEFTGEIGGSTDQVLTLNGEGQFDMTGNSFSETPAELILVENAELYINAASNVTGLNASGDGVLRLASLEDQANIDLSNIAVETVLELGAGGATFAGNFNTTAQVTVEGDALDISGLTDATNTVPANLPGSFVVAEGAAVRMTQEQGNELAASGKGDVVIELSDFNTDPDVDNNADFSGITADTELELQQSVVFGGSIGATSVTVSGGFELTLHGTASFDAVETITVENGATLQLSAAQADGLTIDGAGSVIVTDLDATPAADLSGITAATTLALEADATLDAAGRLPTAAVTVEGAHTLDASAATNFDAESVLVGDGATLVVTDEQVDADVLSITPVLGGDEDGAVTVLIDGDSSANLLGVAADLTIELSADSVFTGLFRDGKTVDLTGNFEFDITAVDVLDLPPGFVLDGTDLVLTAAQGDDLTVTGGSSVRVTDLAAALADVLNPVDLSGITVSDELPGVIEIGENTGIVGEGELNLGDATFTFNDQGDLVGYEGFTFEVAETATLSFANWSDIFTNITIQGEDETVTNLPDQSEAFNSDAVLSALFGDADSQGTVEVGGTPVWTDGAPVTEPVAELATLTFTEETLNGEYAMLSGGFGLEIDFDQDLGTTGLSESSPISGFTITLGGGLTLDDGSGVADTIEISGDIRSRLDTGDNSLLELRFAANELTIAYDAEAFSNAGGYIVSDGTSDFFIEDLNNLTVDVDYDAATGPLEGATGREVADFNLDLAEGVQLAGIPESFYNTPVDAVA